MGPILRRGIVLMALGTLVPAAFGSTPPAGASPTVIRVGYIAQAGSLTGRPTDDPGALGVAGDAGLLGAREGAEEMSYTARLVGRRFELLEAAARTPGEAAQQAQALVGRDADVLLGGFDAGTALALSQFAAQHAILFFNVGAPDDRLRNEDCARYTFHVEASDAMYLDAVADWFIRGLAFLVDENAPQGVRIIRRAPARAWFLITEDAPLYRARRDRLRAALEQRHWGGRIVGDLAVTGRKGFAQAEGAIARVRPDLVFLLLSPARQLQFYSQYERGRLSVEVTGFPDPVTQTRTFFAALLRAAPQKARGGIRLVSWEPTFASIGGPQLAQRFFARWRHPLDGPAWTSWLAVKIVWDAFIHAGSDPLALLRYLEGGGALFEGYQGIGMTFRPWDHQLRHPLMASRLAKPGGDESALAEMVGQFPNVLAPGRDPARVLDQLGDMAQTSRCRWR